MRVQIKNLRIENYFMEIIHVIRTYIKNEIMIILNRKIIKIDKPARWKNWERTGGDRR